MEACGLMAGRGEGAFREVETVYRAGNALNSSSRYQLDPEEQLLIFLGVEGEGKDVVGVYHSHPYWSADFSDVDRSMAYYKDFSYLVYSVQNKEFKSFCYKGDEVIREKIHVI